MSVEKSGVLPLLGPKLQAKWGARSEKRKDKVQIWSAVALQQHFARGALRDGTMPTLEELPPPLPKGRLTLAQKMGLVPLPPPPPTEEEWTKIEGSAVRRNFTVPLGDNACCICQEAFYATMEQGQVLLSCSHVFHENCLRHFEKFARRSCCQGEAALLRCPVCRSKYYHKRTFYLGKALTQRAAIVKIQAFFRRVLARKRFIKLRLERDSEFCEEYARERLARLSDACAAYAKQREVERKHVLSSLELRLQQALAGCMTEAEWGALRERVAFTAAKEGGIDCPICLCAIEQNPRGSNCLFQNAITGEDIIAAFRKEYDARKKGKRSLKKKKGEQSELSHKPLKRAVSNQQQTLSEPATGPSSVRQVVFSNVSNVTDGKNIGDVDSTQLAQKKSLRYGFLLNCGHCFHKTCLSSFERYTEVMALEVNGAPLIPCCPLCRGAYVKVDF